MGRYAELQKAWDENREEFRRLKEEMEKNEDAFLKIDQEMEAMEQEPIKDSDVVVMFSSQFETDYVVCKITDQSREWVKEQMNNIAGMDEDALANLDVEEFFRDQGAEVMSILASNGKGDDYPVFYDFWFDVDEAEVVESTELSIEKQVENLINRIDFGEPVLNDSEWKLLHTYAEKTGNMADTYKLAQELRDTLHHPDFRVHEQVIENARKELEAPVFLNEKEKELFTGETDRFGIYQLKDGEELHYHRFASLDLLEKSGLQVEKGNYELIYTAPLQKGQTLDDIFEQFNLFRPEDFTGHSLSVSDIVLLHQNGENHAQYVDRFGFQEVAQFLEQQQDREEQKAEHSYIDYYYVVEDLQKAGPLDIKKYADIKEALQAYFSLPNDKRKAFGIQNSNPLPGSLDFIQCYNGIDRMTFDYREIEGWDNPEIQSVVEQMDVAIDLHETQIAYAIGGRYFTIQHTDEGFDYTFYSRNYRELDGGVYDNTDLNIEEAMSEILEDENLDYEDGEVLNYESFMEHVEEANRIEPQKLSEEYFSVYAHSAAYAREHGELEQYRISRNENIACKNAIEAAIRDNFDGMHLQPDAAEEVLDGYGMERVVYVLSSSIRLKEQDGRFSRENKEWAKTIPVAEDMDSWERNRNIDFLVDSHPAVLDGFVHLVRQEQAQREAKKEVLKVPPVSDKTEPEKALNQMSRVDIEETVLAYAQSMVDDAGYDVKVTAARVYGSRTADIQREDSDVDVVIEYQGEIREDVFFDMLHENGLSVGGMMVDINPITAEKSGSIEEYLARANQYLEEKVKSFRETTSDQQKAEVVTEHPVQTLTFYVAECMEFPSLGEYHENLTFEEAVHLYEAIPSERMSAVKGIGFTLHTEGTERYMDSEFDLVSGKAIDVDMINHVPEFRDSTLVQQAIKDAIARFPEMKVWDRETKALESQKIAENYDKDCRELAADIDKFSEEYDTYEYWDAVDDREENVSRIYCDLQSGDAGYIREWLQGVIDEGEPVEDVKAAKAFVNRIDDLAERREKNPLTKVEELEEANYNQIDGVLNNIKPEKQEKSDTKGMSIMEKLALNKERVAQADKPAKEPEKKPERSMDK